MRCFTWRAGGLKAGIETVNDERLGAVVFLGEDGRGRRYEKVALARRNPAEVIAGRVMDAHPAKITLPPKDGKAEKVFYVLERPSGRRMDKVVVRINTYTDYVRGASGRWSTISGSPETLVSGYGAFGLAGRTGSWSDGIVLLGEGDVLKVRPSRPIGGTEVFALWLDNNFGPQTAAWQDYENLRAVAQVQALVAETKGDPKALNVAFGSMPTMTYLGRGQMEEGITVDAGVTGPAVILGEDGRGRQRAEIPLVGLVSDGRMQSAAVTALSEEKVPGRWIGDPATVKTVWGLTSSDHSEDGAVLLRVKTNRANRVHYEVRALRGNPVLLASGRFAGGAAGHAESSPDELWVLRSGDILAVGSYTRPIGRVVENVGGRLITTAGDAWEERDGLANPAAYIANRRAPWGHVPVEWIGRVVTVDEWVNDTNRYGEPIREIRFKEEGELVEIRKDSLILNLGWDGRDRKLVTISQGVWIKDTRKEVVAADPERETAKGEVASLREEATALRSGGHFSCLAREIQSRVTKVADGRSDSSWSDSSVDFAAASTEEIRRWAEWAKDVMSKAREEAHATAELHRKQAEAAAAPATKADLSALLGKFGRKP